MDVQWVKIKAWHASKGPVRVAGSYLTYCGRLADSELVDSLPRDKSCETCLRIIARKQDA